MFVTYKLMNKVCMFTNKMDSPLKDCVFIMFDGACSGQYLKTMMVMKPILNMISAMAAPNMKAALWNYI
jgi:hypothetical protein